MDKNTKRHIDTAAGAGTADKLEGNAKEGRGRVEQAAGDLTGNDKLKREGTKDKIEGKAQQVVGSVKEGVEKLADKAKDAVRGH